jgi:TP901 family phage tail tape measure protein
MDNQFSLLLKAAIDLQKSQTDINAQITQLQKGAKELNIELSTANAKKALKELSVEAQAALSQNKVKLDNNITAYIKNNTKLSKDLVSELENVKTKINSVDSSGLKQLGNEFRTITSKANALGQTGDTVFAKLGKNSKQFLNYLGSASLIMTGVNAIRSMIDEVGNLDKSLVDLQMATGDTHEQAKELLNTYIDMGQQMGATGTEVAAAASDYLRQGKTIAETNELIKDSLVLAKIGNIDTADATTYLTTAMKGYKVEVSDVIGIVDKLSAVDLVSATSAGGLATAMAQTATNANMAGVSMEKLLGYLAVVGETTGEAMSSVGNSFSTMFSRMANIKLKSLSDPEAASDLNNVETSLNNVGIALRSDNKTFRDFDDVLDDVAGRWNTFSEVNQRAIAVSIAGKDHMEDFLVLMSNYGKALEYTGTAQKSSGTAMDKFANYEESVEAKTKKLTSSLQELSSDTLNSGVIKGFLDFANALIQATDKIGVFNIAFVGLLAVIGAKTGVFSSLMSNILAITSQMAGMEVATLSAAVAQVGLTGAIKATTIAIKSFLLTNPLGWAVLGVSAIYGLSKAFDYFNATIDEEMNKLEDVKSKYDENSSKIEEVNKKLADTKKRIDEINSQDNLKFTDKEELENLYKTNEQLLIQKDLLEKINASKQKDVINEAVKGFNEQYASYNISPEKVQKNQESLSHNKNISAFGTPEQDISVQLALYKQLIELQKQASESGNDKKYEELDTEIGKVSTNLNNALTNLTKFKEVLESSPKDSLTSTQKKTLGEINSAIDLIYKSLDPDKWKEIQFQDIINKDEVKNEVASLNELAKTKPITPDQVSSSKELMSSLKESGISATEAAEQFNALNNTSDKSSNTLSKNSKIAKETASSLYSLATSAESATGYVSDLGKNVDISKIQDAISKAESSIDDFNNILKSMKDNGGLTSDSLDTISQKYPKLLKYVSDEAQLREELQKAIKEQKKTAEDYYKSVLEMDTDLFKTIVKNNENRINKLSDDYKIDIKNWQSLAQAKADIDGTLLTELNKKWGEYYTQRARLIGLEAELQTNNDPIIKQSNDLNIFGIGNLSNPNSTFLDGQKKKLKELSSEATSAQKNYNELKSIFEGTDYTSKIIGGISSTSDKQKKTKDKTKNEFSQVFDWIAIRIDKLKEKAQKAIDDVSKYIYYKSQNNQLKIAITAQVDEKKSLTSLMKSYNKMADKVKLPKKYQDLVNNGGFNIQTIKNEALAKKIEEYQKWKEAAAGVADEIKNINDKIKELNAQKLTNITEYFGDRNDYISAKISRKESEVLLKTDSGKSPTKHDYKALIKLQNDDKKNSQKELAAYTKQFNEQVKNGDITKNSPEYLKGLSEINDLTKAINESQSAVYNYKTEIRELDWKGFDKGITKVNNIKNELSDLSDMIRDSEILDDKGNYTEAGLTKLGLLSQQMNTNTKLASEYGKAIKKIGNELKNGTITQDQYNEELANYQGLQRQAVKDNQALEDSIAEIAKQRIQFEIDAINKETDAFKELVDAKKEALQAEKDLHDYQESINKKQKSIDTLQKQIAALKSSTERSDIAKRLKLEKDLKDQQADLDEEQYQHSIEAQSDALDDEYDSYKKSQDEKVAALEKSLNDQEALVKSALNEVYSNTTEISTGIQTLASEHGLNVTNSVVSPWEKAKTAIDLYKVALDGLPKDNGADGVPKTGGDSDGSGGSGAGKGSSSGGAASGAGTKGNASTSKSSSTGSTSSSKLPISTVKYTGNKSSLNKDTSIVDRLKYNDLDSSSSARSKLYKYFGLSGSYTGTDSQNAKLIAAMKKAGFSQGGTGKLVNSLEDEGFTLMKRDEAMLSSAQTEQFKTLLGYAPMIKPAIDSISGNNNYPNIQNSNPINIQYDSLIKVEGNVDSSNIKQLELIAQKAVEKGNQTLISLWNQKH